MKIDTALCRWGSVLEYWVATSPDAKGAYGFGATEAQAIEDLRHVLSKGPPPSIPRSWTAAGIFSEDTTTEDKPQPWVDDPQAEEKP